VNAANFRHGRVADGKPSRRHMLSQLNLMRAPGPVGPSL